MENAIKDVIRAVLVRMDKFDGKTEEFAKIFFNPDNSLAYCFNEIGLDSLEIIDFFYV